MNQKTIVGVAYKHPQYNIQMFQNDMSSLLSLPISFHIKAHVLR